MYKKLLSIGILLISFFFIFTQPVYTFEKASGSSAILAKIDNPETPDYRVKILRKFLESYNSPLASSAEAFVKTADVYSLDWRLVASISGVESTFAHHLPYESYNAWGWGIYGDNMIFFTSYDEGIEIISESLRNKYINKWGATNVHRIGKYYAASPTWSQKVEYFMNKIDQFTIQNQVETLSINL